VCVRERASERARERERERERGRASERERARARELDRKREGGIERERESKPCAFDETQGSHVRQKLVAANIFSGLVFRELGAWKSGNKT